MFLIALPLYIGVFASINSGILVFTFFNRIPSEVFWMSAFKLKGIFEKPAESRAIFSSIPAFFDTRMIPFVSILSGLSNLNEIVRSDLLRLI